MVANEKWFGASANFYNGVATQSLRMDYASGTYLSRTPSSTGDQKTWTWSGWIKRTNVTRFNQYIYSAHSGSNYFAFYFKEGKLASYYGTGSNYGTISDREFRDISQWYHIVHQVDALNTTQRVWVNGTELTLNSSRNPGNSNYPMNQSSVPMVIGKHSWGSSYFNDMYLAEVNYTDGQKYEASDFGESKNGTWIPKSLSSLTYGTNGYRLQFKQTGDGQTTASSTTIGADTSDNNNHYKDYNLDSHDSNLLDSPENNFSTWSPLFRGGEKSSSMSGSATTLSEGNLKASVPANSYMGNTFRPTSGKWYCEFRINSIGSTNGEITWGWIQATEYSGTTGNGGQTAKWSAYYHAYSTDHIRLYDEGSQLGSNINLTLSVGDILQLAWDIDNNKGWVGINNTWYRTDASDGNPSAGTNETFTFTDDEAQNLQCIVANGTSTDVFVANFGQDDTFAGAISSSGNTDSSGAVFKYSPPTGHLALCSSNLPETTISPNQDTQADDHFNTVLYSGANNAVQSVTGVGFQGDWLWAKARNVASSHYLYDSTRGANKGLSSNATSAEDSATSQFTSFDSDGFTLPADNAGYINYTGRNYVGWVWKAGGTTPTKTYKVKVVADSTDYGHGTGSNKYQFFKSDGTTGFGTNGVDLDLQEGGTYIFDWSDSSAQSHPIRFSLTNDGTHSSGTSAGSEYTTGVVKDDSSYKTTITVQSGVANLYLYCQNHSGMGSEVRTNSTFGSTNFDGSTATIVQKNLTSGFSICLYTGNGSTGNTIGHELGAEPELLFIKKRGTGTARSWVVYHKSISTTGQALYLDLQNASGGSFQSNQMTSTVMGLDSSDSMNGNNNSYIGYFFKAIDGFSSFGSYTGNGNADGAFIFTGFRPAWILIKSSSNGEPWNLVDIKRDTFNVMENYLQPNTANAEGTLAFVDGLSNGFKLRSSGSGFNGSGYSFIYIAFAEQPFKFSNAR